MSWLIAYVVLSYVSVILLLRAGEQLQPSTWDNEDKALAGMLFTLAPLGSWIILSITFIDYFYGKRICAWLGRTAKNPFFYIGYLVEKVCT